MNDCPGRPLPGWVLGAATVALAIIAGHIAAAQQVQSARFDVASIRRVNGSSPFPPLSSSSSGQLVGRASLEAMIHWAYEVESYERVVPHDAGLARRLQELYEVNLKPPLKTPPYSRAEGDRQCHCAADDKARCSRRCPSACR
jgi:hypothetical protein